MSNDKQATIQVAGQTYVKVKQASFAQDIYVMDIVRRHAFDKLEMGAGETAADFAERICHVAMANGSALDLMGALFCPIEITADTWTPQVARDTTVKFSKITDDADKQVLRAELGTVLAFFLMSGVASLATSRKSTTPPAPSPNAAPREAAAPPTSTTGIP